MEQLNNKPSTISALAAQVEAGLFDVQHVLGAVHSITGRLLERNLDPDGVPGGFEAAADLRGRLAAVSQEIEAAQAEFAAWASAHVVFDDKQEPVLLDLTIPFVEQRASALAEVVL